MRKHCSSVSHCNSEELTVENYSKTRPATHFFWLPPVCPWHVFLPAEAAGFLETGWSCWLLRPVYFCRDQSSEGVFKQLPGSSLCFLFCLLLQQPSRLCQTSWLCLDCCWAKRSARVIRKTQQWVWKECSSFFRATENLVSDWHTGKRREEYSKWCVA